MVAVDLDTVVLAAATSVAIVAQLGIVIAARVEGFRGMIWVGLPALALVALLMGAWMELMGR